MTQLPGPRGGPPGLAGAAGAPAAMLLGAAVRFTGRGDGDMADPTGVDPATARRRRAVVDRAWTVLRQVHGAEVVIVERPGAASGEPGDACVSTVPGAALAVLTADCAPVAFASAEGVIGVAHAGWRGLMAGVLEETVAAMRRLGATSVQAALGPCVHAECYAFGPSDLDRAALHLGDTVRAKTTDGLVAFDIVEAVRIALRRAGADLAWDESICTSCSPDHWSWRAARDAERQATVVWQP